MGRDKLTDGAKRIDASIVRAVEAMIAATSSPSFAESIERSREANDFARRLQAERLTPDFQRFVREQPHATYEEKQLLATRVNELLGQVGLAVECPNTGRPGTVVADTGGREGSASRFRVDTRDESGKRARSWGGRELDGMRLVPDIPRREPLAELHARRRHEYGPRSP